MKTLIIVGSLRKGSYNKLLAEHLKERLEAKTNTKATLVVPDLPNYNEDIDEDGLRPEAVETFNKLVQEADSFIIVTPEYNNSISGVLKTALDWASRTPYLENKPTMLAASSPGFAGGSRAFLALNDILNRIKVPVLPGNDILIAAAHKKFTDDGKLNDEGTIKFIDGVLDTYLEFYKKLSV